MYDDFDSEYDDLIARDQFDAEYGDVLSLIDEDDEFNDVPDWLSDLRDEEDEW